MRRRSFIAGLGSAAAWPLAVRAQQTAMPVIGNLQSESLNPVLRDVFAAFNRGLADSGYVVGQNVAIEYAWAEGHNDRLPALALELVRRRVALIVAAGTPAALAAKAATTTIPVLFFNASDPVQIGLVATLARPGGNITGITNLGVGLTAKRLELLHQLVPSATTIALLANPANPVSATLVTEAQAAARVIGIDLPVLNASNADEIAAAFASLGKLRAGGILVSAESLYITHADLIIALAARYGIPANYEFALFARAGGLMSYGTNFLSGNRQLGAVAGRILNGEKPGDLPVQQAVKFEMVLNMKTAKALGIEVPTGVLLRADEVIE